MFKSTISKSVLATALLAISSMSFAGDAAYNGIGKTISDQAIAPWSISVHFDGDGLPAGKGSVAQGETVYQAKCAMCHGEFGEGAKDEDTVGARGINSLWGHAPTLYDYIRRAMPFFAPQSLSNDEAYATTCYVLYIAEIIKDDKTVCDAATLKATKMPSQDNYYTDTRPDIKNARCMNDCMKEVPVVKEMAVVGVGKAASSGKTAADH